MTLTDAGPLIALLNRNDPYHAVCTSALKTLPPTPLATTWPCFTEAMYLLGEAGGHAAQSALWSLWKTGRLIIHELTEVELTLAMEQMAKYADLPMDLADATLVALAERLNETKIFSMDSDFHVYRFADGRAFELIPSHK